MASQTVIYNIVGRDAASNAFNSAGRSAAQLESKMSKVGKAVKVASVAGAAGIAGLLAIGKKSISLYADFDATIRQVGIQTKSATKPLEKLAIQLGQKTAYSAKDAADAMLELAKSGMTSAQIRGGALAKTLKLAQAGGVELADAAGYMTNSMNAFGLKAKDADKIVTALAGGANASTASVESLGLGLAQASAGARNAGLTLNDTVSVLAAFDNAGIKGSDAGTSLKTMLMRLIPQTDKAKTAMKNLGINFVDAKGNFKSVSDIAQILHDKLGPLTQAQRSQALTTIFGSDATRAASVLMREGSKGINKYEKATRDSGIAGKLAKSRMQGLSGAIENMKGAAETTAIQIGKTIAPAVQSIARFISNDVLPAIGNFVDYLGKNVAPPIGRALAAVKPVFVGFGGWLGDTAFPLIQKGAQKIGGVLGGVFTTVEPAAAAATRFFGDFIAGLSKPKMPKHAVTVDDIVKVQTGVEGNTAGQKAGLAVQGFIKSVTDKLDFGKILDLKNIDWGKIDTGKLGATIGGAIITSLDWVVQHTEEFTGKVFTIVGNLIKSVDWVDVGKQAGGAAIPFAIGFVTNIFGPLFSPSFWSKHWLDVMVAMVSLVPIGRGATMLAAKFGDSAFIGPIIKAIAKIAGPAGKTVEKVSGFILKALGNGIKSAFNKEFPRAAEWLGQHTGGYLSTALGVGKLRVGEIGRKIVDGLRVGIVRGSESLFSEIFSLTKDVVRPFARAGGWLIGRGRDAIGGLGNGIRSGWRPVGDFLGRIKSRVLAPFKGAGKWLLTLGRDIGGGLKAGMSKGLAGLAAVFLTPINWIRDHILNPFLHAISNIPGVPDWSIGGSGSRGGGGPVSVPTSHAGQGGNILGRNAAGGKVRPGGMSWVGERGAEIMQALPGGGVRIYPHGQSVKMARSMGEALPGYSLGGVFGAIKDAAAWSGGKVWTGAKKVGSGARTLTGIAVGALLRGAEKAANAAIGLVPGGDWAKNMAHGVMDTIVNSTEDWIKGKGKKAPKTATGDMSAHSASAGAAQAYAKSILGSFGWAASQMSSLISLWNGESGWNNMAQNPSSSAFGIAQFLNSTWVGKKFAKTTDFKKQVYDGLQYIAGSYGSPAAALSAWLGRSPHWYASGTKAARRGMAVVGERGPELINLKGGEQIFNAAQTKLMGYAKGTVTMSQLVNKGRGYAQALREALPENAMKYQIQQVANAVKAQMNKAFSGKQARFLTDWINHAANVAITNSTKRTAAVGKSLVNNIVQQIDGGNALDKLQGRFSAIYDTVKAQFAGPREKSILGYVRGFNDDLASLARQRDRIAARIQSANELAASTKSAATSFADVTSLGTATPAATVKQLEHKMRDIMNFNYNLNKLSKRGLSKTILQQLIDAGPEAGGAMAQQLVRAGAGQINRLNYLEGRVQRASGRLGTSSVNITMGSSAAVNFVSGLNRQQASLERLMDKLGRRLASSLGKSFGIRGFAKGGTVPAGQLVLVGEDGPEFMRGPGTVTPNGQTMAAMRRRRTGGGSYEGPSADEIGQAIAAYMQGVKWKVDRAGFAQMVNDQNVALARPGRGGRRG